MIETMELKTKNESQWKRVNSRNKGKTRHDNVLLIFKRSKLIDLLFEMHNFHMQRNLGLIRILIIYNQSKFK